MVNYGIAFDMDYVAVHQVWASSDHILVVVMPYHCDKGEYNEVLQWSTCYAHVFKAVGSA